MFVKVVDDAVKQVEEYWIIKTSNNEHRQEIFFIFLISKSS